MLRFVFEVAASQIIVQSGRRSRLKKCSVLKKPDRSQFHYLIIIVDVVVVDAVDVVVVVVVVDDVVDVVVVDAVVAVDVVTQKRSRDPLLESSFGLPTSQNNDKSLGLRFCDPQFMILVHLKYRWVHLPHLHLRQLIDYTSIIFLMYTFNSKMIQQEDFYGDFRIKNILLPPRFKPTTFMSSCLGTTFLIGIYLPLSHQSLCPYIGSKNSGGP